MCGIVGYVGPRDAIDVLLDGLTRLEYRGYDSAGLAAVQDGEVKILRSVGKIINLKDSLRETPLVGTPGIGHTRWATHGRPSEENAHPHKVNGVTVVHNGIIENYVELREELVAQGQVFSSETDTEIIAHLIERRLADGDDPMQALRHTLSVVRGSYAVAVLLEQTPDRLYAARLASPLVLGRGDGENFIASDIPAILSYTRSMLFLEDGEIAELSAEGIRIENATGETVQRQPKNITWSAAMAEKEGYKHFMLKEINEQPRTITDTLRGRISLEHGDVTLDEVPLLTPEAIAGIRRILIIACGTSYHAGLVGRLWIEKFSGIPAEVDLGSEFRYRDPLLSPDTLVVSISQSGETADTLAAVKTAKEEGCKVLSICNVVDSSIARTSDGVLYTHAGPEIGVASTKAFTTQLTALYLLALAMGKATGGLSTQELAIKVDALAKVPGLVEHALHSDAAIRDVAERYYRASDFLYLGRWLNYPIALEGALKLKEISYIHAEGYPAGEMKHGPIALIDEHMPVVVIAPRDKVYEKIVSNLQEAKARHAVVIAVGEEGDNELREHAEEFIPMPACSEESLTPLLTVVPLQMLSYHIADIKGTDVDQPRNLAKSVTVE